MELLPLVPRPRPPSFLRGHRGGAAQRADAEEDRTVGPGEGKLCALISRSEEADTEEEPGSHILTCHQKM